MNVRRMIVIGCLVAPVACTQTPVEPQAAVVKPPCGDPVPLLGTYNSQAPGYIVAFREGTIVSTEVARLSSRFQFTPTDVWASAVLGFAAQLPAATVAALRCDAAVAFIERNNVVQVI